jgi:hypothetical protein
VAIWRFHVGFDRVERVGRGVEEEEEEKVEAGGARCLAERVLEEIDELGSEGIGLVAAGGDAIGGEGVREGDRDAEGGRVAVASAFFAYRSR